MTEPNKPLSPVQSDEARRHAEQQHQQHEQHDRQRQAGTQPGEHGHVDHRIADQPGKHDPAHPDHPDHPNNRRLHPAGSEAGQNAQPGQARADELRHQQDRERERHDTAQRTRQDLEKDLHGASREGEEAAPKDAVDAQQQAFVEEAEDQAKIAAVNAEAAKKRAEDMNQQPQAPEAKAGRIDPEHIPTSDDVVIRTGPRNVDMVTTEEDRLIRHKQMVRGHLRNADPDMTGGTAVAPGEEELDPKTRLPKGHVPEGYQDAPSHASPRNRDAVA